MSAGQTRLNGIPTEGERGASDRRVLGRPRDVVAPDLVCGVHLRVEEIRVAQACRGVHVWDGDGGDVDPFVYGVRGGVGEAGVCVFPPELDCVEGVY